MKGWMYILECSDGSYYTGSTNNLELRMTQHQEGKGANHTKKRLPVTLIYFEEFSRIDEAFYREKQIQGWSRKKKEALINGQFDILPQLAMAYRDLNTVVEVLETTESEALIKDKLEILPHLSLSYRDLNTVVEVLETTESEALPEVLEALPEVLEVLPEVLEVLPEVLEGNDNESIKELI